ncbi:phasin, partial [Klebsiella pneumoniae]
MTQPFQVPNELRDFAEKSVDQARTAVETLFSNAAKAAEQLQTSGHSFQSNLQGAVAKGFDFAQTNTHATFDFAQKVVRS